MSTDSKPSLTQPLNSPINLSPPTTDTNLIVKPSKSWVLPPRPKPGRKSKDTNTNSNTFTNKKLSKPNCENSINNIIPLSDDLDNISTLLKNCSIVEGENLTLKSNLLSLIHEYKQLKNSVLDPQHIQQKSQLQQDVSISSPISTSKSTKMSSNSFSLNNNVHKRSIHEMDPPSPTSSSPSSIFSHSIPTPVANSSSLDSSIAMLSINSQSTTTCSSPIFAEFDQFIKIEQQQQQQPYPKHKSSKNIINIEEEDEVDSEIDINFEEDYDDLIISPTISSSELSRTTSPYSDYESHSLMSTLTRSTTVSSINTVIMDKQHQPLKCVNHHSPPLTLKKMATNTHSTPHNYFELPKYSQDKNKEYNFTITANDEYNMITDFLEEKLINNDINYYIDNQFTNANDGFNW